MESPNLNLTLGRIDCSEPTNLKLYADTQSPATCHVCLSTGAVVGLSFHAQTGLVSLAALLILLLIIARNYIRNARKPQPDQWRLFRGNVDILILNLILADVLMSFGAISDIRWAYDRQVYCGSFCDAQGVLQTMGETAAALTTLAVTIYTFIAVKMDRPPTYRPWLCLAAVVATWLWCLLWPVILLKKYNEAGPGGDKDVEYAFTPTPWWCWINAKYMPERIVAEYLWLWIAGLCSIGLYVPAFIIIRHQRNQLPSPRNNQFPLPEQDQPRSPEQNQLPLPEQNQLPLPEENIQANADAQSIASTIDEGDEAVKLLWYPLVYTLCVLPLSIMRWATFADHSLLSRPQIMPASMVFSSIFNLMGLANVLLIFWTRPAILLIGDFTRNRPEVQAV